MTSGVVDVATASGVVGVAAASGVVDVVGVTAASGVVGVVGVTATSGVVGVVSVAAVSDVCDLLGVTSGMVGVEELLDVICRVSSWKRRFLMNAWFVRRKKAPPLYKDSEADLYASSLKGIPVKKNVNKSYFFCFHC